MNMQTRFALRGIYWQPSDLVEIHDFARAPHGGFALFSVDW
jgi:hypothetical protein